MSDDLLKRLDLMASHRTGYIGDPVAQAAARIRDLEAQVAALSARLSAAQGLAEAFHEIMDGYGLDAPAYNLPDGQEDDWILDTVRTALAAWAAAKAGQP